MNLPLSQDKKLKVIFRVEAGCLGPEGKEHVDAFCTFAQKEVESVDSEFVQWEMVPRHDKSLPEVQYQIAGKNLSHDQVARYLELFRENLDEFEGHMHERLVQLIDRYQGG